MAGETDGGIDLGRETLLRALRDGSVRFVLIGGAALESHDQPHRTEDIDVTPDRERENLERLAASLRRAMVWNLRTPYGKIDLTVTPAGFPDGYVQLAPDARVGRVYATRVEVAIASLADVEHSKRVADPPKDRAYLTRVGRLDPPPAARESVSRDRDYGHEDELEPPSR